jgi:carboxymethylenebutenolidase
VNKIQPGEVMKYFLLLLIPIIMFVSCNSKKEEDALKEQKAKEEIAMKKEMLKAVKYLSGSDSVQAYFTTPEREGKFPAIIVIHEWWGLNDWARNCADVFKNKGYAALAIDLYRGKATHNLEEAQQLMNSLSPDRVKTDLQAAYSFLSNYPKVDKNKIAVAGWGMGSGYALQAASFLTNIKAVSVNYGGLISDPAVIKKISAPVLGIFGETDRSTPVFDVKNFESALKDAKKENKIIIYRNVGHEFMNPKSRDTYNSSISERAWREIFAFFEKQLAKK